MLGFLVMIVAVGLVIAVLGVVRRSNRLIRGGAFAVILGGVAVWLTAPSGEDLHPVNAALVVNARVEFPDDERWENFADVLDGAGAPSCLDGGERFAKNARDHNLFEAVEEFQEGLSEIDYSYEPIAGRTLASYIEEASGDPLGAALEASPWTVFRANNGAEEFHGLWLINAGDNRNLLMVCQTA